MDDEIEESLFNLEFRVMLFEEQCKEVEQKLLTLKESIKRVQADLLSIGDDDYWRAEDV